MSEPYIPNLPSGAEKYNPSTFDFVSFADKKYISDSSPVLSADDKTYRTPDGKTYLKHEFTIRDQDDTIVGNDSAYKVFDSALALIEFINPKFEKTEQSYEEEKCSTYNKNNTTTEDILNWALNTYNFKNPENTIRTIDEARALLFNGSINYYFSQDGTEHECVHIDENNIWFRSLPNLTNTGSIVSLTENTNVNHFQGMLDNVENGDYLFCNSPLLESVCSNTFPSLQSGRYMFASCPSIVSFHIPSAPQHSDYMFSDCTSLSQLNFENFTPETFSGIFNNTPKLSFIDFGNTSIDKISSISHEDVASVTDLTLTTEETDQALLEKLFDKYTNLNNLNIRMSPFPFKDTDTENLCITKSGSDITFKFRTRDVNITATSEFEKDMSEFFMSSPLRSVTITSELSCLTMAKNTFSASAFKVDSVQSIYDALPTYSDGFNKHIITLGIDITPSEFYFTENDFRNLCGNFAQWNNGTQQPVYETNVTSALIEGDLGNNRFEIYALRDEEYEEYPKSELQYVGWITESVDEKGCKTYALATLPNINKNGDNINVSFSNFRCLYNTYQPITIDDYTFVEAVLHNAFDGDLSSYNGEKDSVYVQIIKPQSPTSPPELPDESDNVYRINYEPQVGDTVVYAGRLSDLEDDSITLDKSTLYHYYIQTQFDSEGKQIPVELQITPIQDKTTQNKFDFINSEYKKGDDYEISFNLPSVSERVCTTVSFGDIRISSNEGKSLGFVTSENICYSWGITPEKTSEGNLLFTITELQNFGISWQIIEEEVEVPTEEGEEPTTNVVESIVHRDIDVSNTAVNVKYTKENNTTTVTFDIPSIEQDIIVQFSEMYFPPYNFFISDLFTDDYNITNPRFEQKNSFSSVRDTQINTLTENETIVTYDFTRYVSETESISLSLNVKLPQTLPEDNFFYNAGFIYENFKTIDEPVVLLKDDAFREKGWKLDLRFIYEEVSPVAPPEPEIDDGTPAPPQN